MKKINLLIVNGTLHIGGAEHVILTLVRNIDRSRFNITVCHINQGGAVKDKLLEENYNVVGLPKKKNGKANYFSSLELRKIIKKKNIDIIHSHDLASFFDSAICRFIIPSVRLVHTCHFGNYPHRPKKYLRMEKLLWWIPDRIIAVGNSQKRKIIDTFKMKKNRIKTIWNGIDKPKLNSLEEVKKYKAENEKVLIGSISTLIPQKGLSDLLKIISIVRKRNNNFKLIIVGHGDLREKLESEARQLKIDDIIKWMGWVPNASSTVLPELDIFIQTSHWEAMSVVILEAMAMSKAIVATKVGENCDVIEDGVTGLISEAGDIDVFANKLESLIIDRDQRQNVASAGYERYKDKFTSDRMINAYEKLYSELVSRAE